MSTQNMTLLSQEEIDILLSFLLHQKSTLSTNVLDQANIDKLISIIRNSEPNQMNLFFHSHLVNNFLKKNLDDFQLFFQINDQTDFIELFALNIITKEEVEITPACLITSEKNTNSTWGYTISPMLFHNIATHLNLKYTNTVYESICKLYSLKNFGDANYILPAIYLPSTAELQNSRID